nr:hypothetical protein C5F59_00330 [Streptomyces sp. QL37]
MPAMEAHHSRGEHPLCGPNPGLLGGSCDPSDRVGLPPRPPHRRPAGCLPARRAPTRQQGADQLDRLALAPSGTRPDGSGVRGSGARREASETRWRRPRSHRRGVVLLDGQTLGPPVAYHASSARGTDGTVTRTAVTECQEDGMTPPKAVSAPREPATSSMTSVAEESLETRARKALVDWLTKEHPAPGQPVPVREFARRLGMSRTPVRSAVGRLYERGLLAYDPVAGFTVAIPSLSSIYELFELRLMLESHALRLFGERTDREPPARLRELVDEADVLARESVEDHTRYIDFRENDSRFHRAMVELGGLPRLLELHDDLHLSIHVTRTGMEAPITASRLNTAVSEHRAVVDALERGDRSAARDLLEAHILRVRDQTIAFLARPTI